MIISIIRQAKNDDYEASDSVCKVVTYWAVMRYSENFTLTAPKCRSDDKH